MADEHVESRITGTRVSQEHEMNSVCEENCIFTLNPSDLWREIHE
jgi:hypothetical protein